VFGVRVRCAYAGEDRQIGRVKGERSDGLARDRELPRPALRDTQLLSLARAEIHIELVVQVRNAGWSNFDYTESMFDEHGKAAHRIALVASLVDGVHDTTAVFDLGRMLLR
jgi:hypothetical protein